MKLHEAIAKHNKSGCWFRPTDWAGAGQAYKIKEGSVCCVPAPRGGSPGITPSAVLLAGEWDCIAPDDVLAERS